ncbi:hypothetical protein NVP2275O_056 [Vibrio phage 2.275.O._10N.286.54.E11]|nr:hypothetical protein NVP2275O_056 [Vibrio phage 2.275.O._10N.286.54.E11]
MAGKKRVHKTYRGKVVDLDALIMMNEQQVAVGNANMNARGDVLGKGGIVKKSVEEINEEYYQQQVRSQTQMHESPAVNKPKASAVEAEESIAPTPKRRKTTSKKKGD